jgi:hypothetical protein
MILHDYRKVADALADGFGKRDPLGFMHPHLADLKEGEVSCAIESDKPYAQFPLLRNISFGLAAFGQRLAGFRVSMQPDTQAAFYDIYYKPITCMEGTGLGHDVLRRLVHGMLEQNIEFVTTNAMPGTRASYFDNAGFIILDQACTVHEQIARGQTLDEIRAVHELPTENLNPDCDYRALADLTDPKARAKLLQAMQL